MQRKQYCDIIGLIKIWRCALTIDEVRKQEIRAQARRFFIGSIALFLLDFLLAWDLTQIRMFRETPWNFVAIGLVGIVALVAIGFMFWSFWIVRPSQMLRKE